MTERPTLNTGTPWSEMDIFDLRYSLEQGDTPEKVAGQPHVPPQQRSATFVPKARNTPKA